MPAPRSPEVAQLLTIIDAAYDRRSWHGPNLRGSIRGVTIEQAAWRPAPSRHNIWELVVHAAYWKYVALRRLTGATRGSFVLHGSNWFTRPADPAAAAWQADKRLLEDSHRALRSAVERLSPRELAARPHGSQDTALTLLSGVAAHDLYHAGQIQLLKKLWPGTRSQPT